MNSSHSQTPTRSRWWPSWRTISLMQPSQTITHLTLRFVLTQTSHYPQFMSLHSSNSNAANTSRSPSLDRRRPPTGSPLNKATAWRSLVTIHDRVVMLLYVVLLIKYRVLALITPGSPLEEFQYIDCFLVGRYKFIGRTTRCSGQLVTGFVLLFGLYRFACIFMHLDFKFNAMEFLLNDLDEVCAKCHKRVLLQRTPDDKPAKEVEARKSQTLEPTHQLPVVVKQHSAQEIDSTCYIENPFACAEWILRLNRTPESWLQMSRCTLLMLMVAIFGFLAWNALIWYMIAGSVLTDLGFEMSYPTCVNWLSNELRLNRSTPLQASIYQPIGRVASEMEIDKLPARIPISVATMQHLTTYNTIRMLADVLENQLIYMEFGLAFSATFYLITIQSIDVSLNGILIKSQLKRLLARFNRDPYRMRRAPGEELRMMKSISLNLKQQSNRRFSEPSNQAEISELTRLQAILLDHSRLTTAYNQYISFYFLFQFALWLSYTLIVCAWMASIKSPAIEFEFVVAETGATLLSVVMFSTAAIVRSINIGLYPIMLSITARDSNYSTTRQRWLTLIKCFYPHSMFCFKLMNSSEISWLYCLKLISWTLSAFVVLASFFYMKKVP